MTRTVTFVVGPPGVGKTVALRGLLDPFGVQLVPSPKWTLCPPLAMVGHYTSAGFDGGDTVPYNGAAAALDYWRDTLLPDARLRATVFDGDRFSSASVLERVQALAQQHGLTLACVLLTADAAALAARRAARSSTQNPAWMKGRATKAQRFADGLAAAGTPVLSLDTTAMPIADVQQQLREVVLP